MFKMRINKTTAALYRRAIVTGINQARAEFGHQARLRGGPMTAPGQMGISEAVKTIELEGVAYRNEKRKRGWVSKPVDRRDEDDKQNGMNTALQAALAAF